MKDRTKIFRILSCVSGGLTLLSGGLAAGWKWGIHSIFRVLAKIPSEGEAASIGIIGGADGPTAIYISGMGTQPDQWLWLGAAAFAVLTVIFALLGKGKGHVRDGKA